MEFQRGAPQGKLKKLGAIMNRRGTKIRFKPDEKIFGKGCAFKPARLFKMARSKAYLFGGVKISWTCDPALITDDTPAKAEFHFPGGLKDYLLSEIDGQTLVTKEIFAGRTQGANGHGSVEWAVAWVAERRRLPALLLQHHPDARRRHARDRPAPGAVQGLCAPTAS